MDFITIAKQRMSVRNYKKTKVEPEKLEKILEAAHVAPTAANLQPVHLIAVQSEEGLAASTKRPWPLSSAPTTIRHGCGLLTRSRPATLTPLS